MRAKKSSAPAKEQTTYNILNDDTPWTVKEAYKTMRTNVTREQLAVFFRAFAVQSPVKQRASPERTARLSGTNGV